MATLQRTVKAVIRQGDVSGYVAECVEIPVVTQGLTIDETVANLREAVGLALEGENLEQLGLHDEPSLLITMETDLPYAKAS